MRLRAVSIPMGAAALLALAAGGARAQGITISPLLGVYTQANSVDQLRGSLNTTSIKRGSALAFGGDVEMGFLRASLNYVSGATLTQSGTSNLGITGDVGSGRILMGAIDAVLRPLPRMVMLQPYALAGIGFKTFDYDPKQDLASTFGSVKSNSTAAFHAGIGADLMLGGFGLVAELTDYMSQGQADASGTRQLQHDAYGLVGLRFRL